jgi:predicted lipoprotein with Yx(FWY)xxD motif
MVASATVLILGVLVVSAAAVDGRTASAARTVVKVAFNKKLKRSILVDGRGLTVYMFTADSAGKPTCYNDPQYHCSQAWPPLLTTGAPRAAGAAKASLLGVARRTGGKKQVTYNRHPLYTNAGSAAYGLVADKKPGDVNGQGFLGIWYVLSPKGAEIRK